MKTKTRTAWKGTAYLRYFLLIFFAMLLESQPALANDASSFLGQWASVTLEGAGPISADMGCQVVAWTDREIKLEPITGNPGRVRGEWIRTYQALWVMINTEKCRFPGESKFEPIHLAVIGWTVTGVMDPSSGRMRVNATYRQCNGTLCDLMQASQRDFQTELASTGGELLDADPTQKPEDHRAFIPKSAEAARIDGALRELKPLLAAVDSGDVNRLYDEAPSKTKSAVTRDQMRTSFAELRAKTGVAQSRSVMQTIYTIYGPNNDMHRNEFAIIVNNIYYSQNRNSLEFSVLQKESGKWRMGYYYIGGKTESSAAKR